MFLFILLITYSIINAQNSTQKQQLTKVAQDFMALYNTGDTMQYRNFLSSIMTENPDRERTLMGYKNAFGAVGKVDIKKTIFLSPEKVEVWARDKKYEGWWKFTLLTDSAQHFQKRLLMPVRFNEYFIKSGSLSNSQIRGEVDNYITKKLGNEFAGNVFIYHKGEVLYSKSFGNNSDGKPNTIGQRFDLASLGKMFTAISILQLKDKKILSLEDKVEKFLPHLKNKAVANITVGQLLTHSSGMGDFFQDPLYDKIKDSIKTSTDFLPVIENEKLAFAPGKGWAYSNTGFILLGIIIEKVTNESYGNYVHQHIFLPAGMGNSNQEMGAGGGKSTIDDLHHFTSTLLASKLLSKQTTQELLSYTVNGDYGYGTEHQQLGAEHIVGHSGGFINVCTELNIYSHSKDLVIILSNSNPPYGHFIADKIKELLVRK
jgi:D-alanyl-D-alanine carboxypeptidase